MTVSRMLTAEEASEEFDRRAETLLADLLRLKARLRRELRRMGHDHHHEWRDHGGEAG